MKNYPNVQIINIHSGALYRQTQHYQAFWLNFWQKKVICKIHKGEQAIIQNNEIEALYSECVHLTLVKFMLIRSYFARKDADQRIP